MNRRVKIMFFVLFAYFWFIAFCGIQLMSVDNSRVCQITGTIELASCFIILGAIVIVFALKYGED